MIMVSSLLLCWMDACFDGCSPRPRPRPHPPPQGRRTVKKEGELLGGDFFGAGLGLARTAPAVSRGRGRAGVRHRVLPGAGGYALVRREMCVAPRQAIIPRGSGRPMGKAFISSGVKGRLSSTGMGGPHGGLTEAAAPGGPAHACARPRCKQGWCRGAVQRRPQHYAMLSTSVIQFSKIIKPSAGRGRLGLRCGDDDAGMLVRALQRASSPRRAEMVMRSGCIGRGAVAPPV